MSARETVRPRWMILRLLGPEELAAWLARELDDGVPVDWGEWLREVIAWND